MICPECHGKGETIYYVETDRDENSVTVEQRRGICRTCNGSGAKPLTNADRIRAMSDAELAEIISENILTGACNDFSDIPGKNPCPHNCKECVLEWLQQEDE